MMFPSALRTFLTILAALSFVNTAQGRPALHLAGQAGWTPARATATVKARYTTADPKAVAIYQANIDQQLAAGKTETDPTVIRLRALLAEAQHMAKVTAASCAGVGKPVRGRYVKFRCRATVAGRPNLPPDYKTFTATVRLVLTVKGAGYRITQG